jgi:hypothetical protein
MFKNKPTIIFNNKEMNLLEARLYWLKLNLRIAEVELSDEENEDYTQWRDFRENRNALAKKLERSVTFHNISERAYVIDKLGEKIEFLSKKRYCKVHLHEPKKDSAYTLPGIEGAVTQCVCKRCGQVYEENTSDTPISNPFRG